MARKTQHSFIVVQPLSHVRLSATSWTRACQAPLSSTVSQKLLKFMSIESVMLSSHLIFCRPIFLLSSIFPSIRIFSNELPLHIMQPKYWSFSFNISPSSEYLGLISFKIDWFDILAVHWTLKILLQHHNLKASVLQCSAFYMVQIPHPYTTTGKTIALTRWTFVGKVMLFNFKEQVSLNFMAAVTIHSDSGAQENKICHCFHFSLI